MAKKITIAIPFHWMGDWSFFLTRCLTSIKTQTFKDYEIVLINHSTMPVTSNRVMEAATGELVKILYMDDYLAHDNALQEIVDNFTKKDMWLATGCLHQEREQSRVLPHFARYSHNGRNTIGSPSVMTFRREGMLYFDEKLSWLLDVDLYKRYYEKYGEPRIVDDLNVVIGIGDHQMTNILTEEQKQEEHYYLEKKYDRS